jgi:hypothetical protein
LTDAITVAVHIEKGLIVRSLVRCEEVRAVLVEERQASRALRVDKRGELETKIHNSIVPDE